MLYVNKFISIDKHINKLVNYGKRYQQFSAHNHIKVLNLEGVSERLSASVCEYIYKLQKLTHTGLIINVGLKFYLLVRTSCRLKNMKSFMFLNFIVAVTAVIDLGAVG